MSAAAGADCGRCAELSQQLAVARAERDEAQGQLAVLRKLLFGPKGEARQPSAPVAAEPPAQDGTATDSASAGPTGAAQASESAPADPPPAPPPPAKPRSRGRPAGAPNPGRVPRPHVLTWSEHIDLAGGAPRCPQCGSAYLRDGYVDSQLYELLRRAVRRVVRRQRYKPACACGGGQPLVAPAPPRLGERTQLGTSVWAWILTQVGAQHRPQAAVARELEQLGLPLPLATLSAGWRRLTQALLEPLEQAIERHQQAAAVAHADETSWPVQSIAGQDNGRDPPPAGGKLRCWLWVCVTAQAVRLRVLPSRSAAAAQSLLGKLGQHGPVILVCDRYSAYKALRNRLPETFVLAYCWAHQRRDFDRASAGLPDLQAWVDSWLERIGRLFHLAKLRRAAWQADRPLAAQTPAFAAHHQALASTLDALFEDAAEDLSALDSALATTPLGGQRWQWQAQRKPLAALLNHRAGLSVFLAHPAVPLDNNLAERTLRGPVIARRLSFGSGGPHGAEAIGLLCGVLATVKLAGLNPYTWLLDYLNACAANRGQPPAQLDPWLPWCMHPARQQALSQPPAQPWPHANYADLFQAARPELPLAA